MRKGAKSSAKSSSVSHNLNSSEIHWASPETLLPKLNSSYDSVPFLRFYQNSQKRLGSNRTKQTAQNDSLGRLPLRLVSNIYRATKCSLWSDKTNIEACSALAVSSKTYSGAFAIEAESRQILSPFLLAAFRISPSPVSFPTR